MGRVLKMLEDEFRARQYDPKKLGLRMMEAGVGIMHSKKTPDSKEDEQKKRYEMPADEYGKMIDRTMGESKGRLKGDYNEEPDTAPVRKAKGSCV